MVTRMEIADCVGAVFDNPPASKSEILEAASSARATSELLSVLDQLPEQNYGQLRDLWRHLPDVPVST